MARQASNACARCKLGAEFFASIAKAASMQTTVTKAAAVSRAELDKDCELNPRRFFLVSYITLAGLIFD